MHHLSQTEGQLALQAARLYAESAVTGRPPAAEMELSGIFTEKRGVFVTLTKFGDLRGCIGFPFPVMPLAAALKDAAQHAAIHDPRFYPVNEGELSEIRIEVTILTQPILLECEPELRPAAVIIGRHGLIADINGHTVLLLPQVAAEYGWGSVEFLSETCYKAGLRPDAWKDKTCNILTFEGQIFKE